ncbi:MAG: OsmC family peroxiredoxin [Alteromonadaceae bacterium]|uniref:OsmC family protein n=1 Tax=unclassified Marinobacter TaxID=83889 RepID=UPI000C3CB887|nr:OsmC family protein [Marinobacter sp. BGYM27]MAA63956.1 OsmC family peroxiredoxin [Alteromonadaceae bacterium]MBH85730.1 OsmC family peroxiredoxin [Alteromonadaceae bacterium]MDG5500378.1 OsmC family protein [Marinobacter sp. BGYM27]|tara:strand:+ start:9595 stop:10020 length:426 start_codon:yes stop_codon:yes gene_type:complete
MKREGSAHWEGDLKSGTGTVSTQSGALDNQPYGFNTRFEDGKGTNPEELIGAAHASCFSMALSMILGEAGFKADHIDTKATVTLDKQSDGFAITAIHLDVKASVPKASESDFAEAAKTAKENCPISKVLSAEISMKATLEG